jgi:replicative DNA helicase
MNETTPTPRDRTKSKASMPNLVGRILPHNTEAEEVLLASCLLEGEEILTQCVELKIEPDAFYRPAHKLIFKSLQNLHQKGNVIHEIALSEALKKEGELENIGGMVAINNLSDRIETTAHFKYFAEIVKEKATLRKLIRTATTIVENAYTGSEDIETFLNTAEQEFFKISQDRVTESATHIKEPIERAAELVQKLIRREHTGMGVSSGFKDLDDMTFGFHPGQMIVLAARPSVGKTSLAMNFAEAAALPSPGKGDPFNTLVFSLEMTEDDIAMRLLCCRARVNMKRLRDGFASNEEQTSLAESAQEIKNSPLWLDDTSGIKITELRAKARRVHSKAQLGLIVIDYLQLISGSDPRAPREQQISDISRNIKGMAKELDVPVVVLSQLNRESEKEKRDPRLSDLRESGAIEQDADVVFILHRSKKNSEDEDSGSIEGVGSGDIENLKLIIAKQRNGPVGDIDLVFNRSYTRFENSTINYV